MGNQIIQSIKTIAQSLVDKAGYDKTRGGVIVGVNSVTNTYSVKIDGVTYPTVRAVDGATYNVGDVVKVVIPCNQATQMYIASSVLSDNSLGNKIANAVGLAQDAAKVATNYIEQDDTDGLIFGDKTSGTWSGYHSQILSDRFNILDESSTVLASFGTTTVIGEEAKANMHLTFNNLSMVDKNGTKFFEVGDNRNAEGIATIKHTAIVVANSAGTATVTVNSYISSIVSVYADSVQLSSSRYSFNNETVTINGFTANSVKYIEITYTTRDSTIYLTIGSRETSGNIGNYSIAEGRGVIASGDASHAEGTGTTASGVDSHAEGWGTEAIGSDSHAEGFITNATGDCSHAEGNNTTASGWVSHAEGEGTVASGEFSHAGGGWTVADGNYMTAIGQLNTKNSGKAFVIGNGTDDTARSDAFTVDWSGNTVMKGGLTLGTPLSIANGGTGATTAAAARSNLGINASNLGIADYIVEQGTSGIWTYKKWNSGIVEAWANVSTTQAIATALGNVYRAPNAVTTNFPFTITEPKVHLASQSGVVNGAYIAELSNASFIWYPIKYGKDTASKVRTIAAYVNGKWK